MVVLMGSFLNREQFLGFSRSHKLVHERKFWSHFKVRWHENLSNIKGNPIVNVNIDEPSDPVLSLSRFSDRFYSKKEKYFRSYNRKDIWSHFISIISILFNFSSYPAYNNLEKLILLKIWSVNLFNYDAFKFSHF